jgi:hypothetical protein
MGVDPRWTENQRVAQAASGSANELVPALADIVATGHWAEFTHPMRGVMRFESFARYCDDFLGLMPRRLPARFAGCWPRMLSQWLLTGLWVMGEVEVVSLRLQTTEMPLSSSPG